MQNEKAERLELLDNEAALGFRCAVRDEVTHVKILQVIDDVSDAWPVCREQQFVDPTGGVPAATVPAHLDEPRPDVFRWSINSDAMSDHKPWFGHDAIAWHPGMPLVDGRAVCLP